MNKQNRLNSCFSKGIIFAALLGAYGLFREQYKTTLRQLESIIQFRKSGNSVPIMEKRRKKEDLLMKYPSA